jgi:hypothetical protein
METSCSIPGCSLPARRRGWCQMHYGRWYRTGDPLEVRKRGAKQARLVDGDGLGWHRDEEGGWWYLDARQRYRGEERICAICGEVFPFRTSHAKFQPGLYCSRECSNKAEKPNRRIPKSGSRYRYIRTDGYAVVYEPNSQGRKQTPEHRKVMERKLGRPLLPLETVHHINGQRADNREENLELWSSRHPKGQRVEDLLAFAREIVDLYG